MPDSWVYALTVLSLALAAYAATNIDNLLILSGLVVAGNSYPVVARGLVIASVGVALIVAAFMALDFFLPPAYFGYLGLIPILLGFRMLLNAPTDSGEGIDGSITPGSIALLLLGNSADTIATFAPLVAESERPARFLILVAFAAGVIALLSLVRYVSQKESNLGALRSLAQRATPIVMILVGIYILLNTGTDTVY